MDEITKEQALELHYKMWKEMKDKLGNNCSKHDRNEFKHDWCEKWCDENGYLPPIENNCFLCEYCGIDCSKCPIDWSSLALKPYEEDIATCCDTYKGGGGLIYCSAPISDILNLPKNNESE